MNGPGIESQREWDFLQPSKSALGSTQSPIQPVPAFFPEGRVAGAWYWTATAICNEALRIVTSSAIALLPLYAFVACTGTNLNLLRCFEYVDTANSLWKITPTSETPTQLHVRKHGCYLADRATGMWRITSWLIRHLTTLYQIQCSNRQDICVCVSLNTNWDATCG